MLISSGNSFKIFNSVVGKFVRKNLFNLHAKYQITFSYSRCYTVTTALPMCHFGWKKWTKHISVSLVHLPGQNMEYADGKKLFVGSAESSRHGHQLRNQFCSDQIFVAECISDTEQMPVEPGIGCIEIILTVNTLSFSDNLQEKALLSLGYCNHLKCDAWCGH